MPRGYHKTTGLPIFQTHGMSDTRFWRIYQNIKQRCYDEHNTEYKRYGGRGIKVEWNSFEEFKADMYEGYSDTLSIDRIDNNGNYSKENCRWATSTQQANNRRSNRYLEFEGQIKSMAEWARELNIGYLLIKKRLMRGWSVHKALTTKREDKYLNKLSQLTTNI